MIWRLVDCDVTISPLLKPFLGQKEVLAIRQLIEGGDLVVELRVCLTAMEDRLDTYGADIDIGDVRIFLKLLERLRGYEATFIRLGGVNPLMFTLNK